VVKSALVLLVVAPLTYLALELMTWASSGQLASTLSPADAPPACVNCGPELARPQSDSLTASAY